jgi:hypothetical protein
MWMLIVLLVNWGAALHPNKDRHVTTTNVWNKMFRAWANKGGIEKSSITIVCVKSELNKQSQFVIHCKWKEPVYVWVNKNDIKSSHS